MSDILITRCNTLINFLDRKMIKYDRIVYISIVRTNLEQFGTQKHGNRCLLRATIWKFFVSDQSREFQDFKNSN